MTKIKFNILNFFYSLYFYARFKRNKLSFFKNSNFPYVQRQWYSLYERFVKQHWTLKEYFKHKREHKKFLEKIRNNSKLTILDIGD